MKSIIVLPAAGSLGYEYSKWLKYFPSNVKLGIVLYPGRGRRICENFADSWEALVDTAYQQVKALTQEEGYILFGHSMGSKLAYEVYFKLLEENKKLPKAICFAGNEAPSHNSLNNIAAMSEKEFREYFIQIGGIREEVFVSEELTDMLFETLRKDITLLETFHYLDRDIIFEPDIYVMNGIFDYIESVDAEWKQTVKKEVSYLNFEGGHFFVFEQIKAVINFLISFF